MRLKLLGARIVREERRTQCKVMLWGLGDGTFRIIGIERQSFQEDLSTHKAALPRAGVRCPVCCIFYIQLYIVRASQRTIKKGISPSFWERNSSSNVFCISVLLVRLVCSACFLIAHSFGTLQ